MRGGGGEEEGRGAGGVGWTEMVCLRGVLPKDGTAAPANIIMPRVYEDNTFADLNYSYIRGSGPT